MRTGKATLAAVLSFVVAERLKTSPEPILAPLTALLVIQLTMYQTVTQGFQRVGSVIAGVLVALGVANWAGLTWWSLGTVVFISLVVGRFLRLGPQLLEVPISAMLVLSVAGGRDIAAWGRVYETLIGAAIGVAVNAFIAPPLHVDSAAEAMTRLATRITEFLRGLAAELRTGWSRAAADRWLQDARGLRSEVAQADQTLARAEESARLNPRGGRARDAQPRLRIGLTGLEHFYVSLRNVCRALLDRTYFLPAEQEGSAYGEELRMALADVLDSTAAAIETALAVIVVPDASEEARERFDERMADVQLLRDRLSQLLLVDPHADPGGWEQHGALLAAIDRLRVEIQASVRPATEPWRPTPVSARQRQVVQQLLRGGRRNGQRRGRPWRTVAVAAAVGIADAWQRHRGTNR